MKGFLNANKIETPEELIELVKSVEENPEKYEKMIQLPAVDEFRRDLVRRRLSELSRRIFQIGTGKDYLQEIPRFLGATSTAEAQQFKKDRESTSSETVVASPIRLQTVTPSQVV